MICSLILCVACCDRASALLPSPLPVYLECSIPKVLPDYCDAEEPNEVVLARGRTLGTDLATDLEENMRWFLSQLSASVNSFTLKLHK